MILVGFLLHDDANCNDRHDLYSNDNRVAELSNLGSIS
jgi:hypothetical protein